MSSPILSAELQEKIAALKALGAGDFEHTNDTLLTHLIGTRQLLINWRARQALADAGLFHASYGTAGFAQALVDTAARSKITEIIGAEAENLVYHYCACDREFVWPQFTKTKEVIYRNRFTMEEQYLTESEWRDFCELTVANELDIAQHNAQFVAQYGEELLSVFTEMQPYLTTEAQHAIKDSLS